MEILDLKINGRETGEEGYQAAVGERLALSWKCGGCDGCVIYPYGWEGGPEGSAELFAYQPMTLLFRAYDKKESVQKEIPVTLSGKECLKGVSVQPAGIVKAGEETVFSFGLEHTDFGYLDHGIGRVEGDSSRQFLRDNYSVYRYCILSGSTGRTAFQEQTVKAGRDDALALDRLRYLLTRDGESQLYRLEWRIANHGGAPVSIRISDSSEEIGSGPSGCKEWKREGGDVRTLSIRCRKQTGEELYFGSIYPYEIK